MQIRNLAYATFVAVTAVAFVIGSAVPSEAAKKKKAAAAAAPPAPQAQWPTCWGAPYAPVCAKKGDLSFFYHTGDEKQVVGIVEVVKEAHPDSTDGTGQWDAVDVAAVADLPKPVTLAEITLVAITLLNGFRVVACAPQVIEILSRARSGSRRARDAVGRADGRRAPPAGRCRRSDLQVHPGRR